MTVDLTLRPWRLHTVIGSLAGPGYMGQALPSGSNTDVVFTFMAPGAETAPIVLGHVEATWYRAKYAPSPDPLDTEENRGEHWARIFPAAVDDHTLVQIVQMNYEMNGVPNPNALRIYVGRLYERAPVTFWGHGAGNDGYNNWSFTFTEE